MVRAVESRLSGDKEARLVGFLGSLDSSSSKRSQLRERRLDDFRRIEGGFGSTGELVAEGISGSRLSRVSVLEDNGFGVQEVGVVRRGGRRFFGRIAMR